MKLGKLLSNKRMLTSEISLRDYHIGLLNTDVEDFEEDFPEVKGKDDFSKAKFLVDLYKGKMSIENRFKERSTDKCFLFLPLELQKNIKQCYNPIVDKGEYYGKNFKEDYD